MTIDNNKTTGRKLMIAVALQLVILTSFAVRRACTVTYGRTITLAASIYDPFDVFRGDYINLQYEIGNPSNYGHFDCGRQVFAVIKEGNPYWQLEGVYERRPTLNSSKEVIIKGKVDYSGIKYGIERFYVPEGRGKVLEKRRNLIATVAVDDEGTAIVKAVEPRKP